jgi:hypothetical protein
LKKEKGPTIIIELFFMHNFKAHFLFNPSDAVLKRNVAEIGQMTSKIEFKLGNKKIESG